MRHSGWWLLGTSLTLAAGGCAPPRSIETAWAMPAGSPPRSAAGATAPASPPGYPFGYGPSLGREGDAVAHNGRGAPADVRGDLPETGTARPHGIWRTDERSAWRVAHERGAGMLIVFVADWSKPANQLRREIFGNPSVTRAIATDFVALEIDVTEDTAENREQLDRYRVLRLPVVLVLDSHGRQIDRIEALLDRDAFMTRLSAARARLPALRAGL